MSLKVFVAGATGAIGRRLLPLLQQREYRLFATTRSSAGAAELERAGVTASVVDVFDAPAVLRALESARPDIVIHELTDLALVHDAPIEGVVLRYGWFCGPGANAKAAGSPAVHVDAAANAAMLAVERGAPGAYNVCEPGPSVSIDKARRELGWDPDFRAS